ncbi:hypothetical protein ACFWAR_19605 [Streptomyces sp. NPDC059917]|uniref:hypothetical protein n=1 Tax=Streptomyces sp. NPDC059917 TaxID=3347002 RepID=UPI0036564000
MAGHLSEALKYFYETAGELPPRRWQARRWAGRTPSTTLCSVQIAAREPYYLRLKESADERGAIRRQRPARERTAADLPETDDHSPARRPRQRDKFSQDRHYLHPSWQDAYRPERADIEITANGLSPPQPPPMVQTSA